jgi:hypothetical protein
MRLKKKKDVKTKTVSVRLSEKDLNKLKIKAGMYTEGNVSEWIVFAGLEHRPNKVDLE